MRATGVVKQLARATEAQHKTLEYARSLVHQSEYEQYLTSYFYPAHARPALFAIRALNVELARIDDDVSNPMVGRIRYQWWRDAIKSAFEGNPLPHPLINLLATLPQTPFLSPYHFSRLVTAREQHFLNPTFTSLQDLADYSAGTQASLLYLLLQTLDAPLPGQPAPARTSLPHASPFQHTGGEHDGSGVVPGQALKEPDSLTLDHAASHLAVANTIAILLRSIPHHASKRISVIPTEIASRHSLTEESLFRHGPEAPGLQESVASLVGIAEAELRTARSCFDGTTGIPKKAAPAFLSATPARSYLERLGSEQVDYNVFDVGLAKRYWKTPFQIWGDARNTRF
ncbi:protein of squalene/phytoene synthase family [Pseudohyphozyma bogoriensis]|nr:protein of squalene/phytoene synthase family [Pseudohyphozyma bogoriensis]